MRFVINLLDYFLTVEERHCDIHNEFIIFGSAVLLFQSTTRHIDFLAWILVAWSTAVSSIPTAEIRPRRCQSFYRSIDRD